MSLAAISYRNGKYQGYLNNNLQRHGPGILIDDDLTFHASNWHQNKMQGSTLVYLTHAKYIYGEWKNNQPHGLNVYRSGDTVLLSKYIFGVPTNRCLLIFERLGFACVLGETNKQWSVIKSGILSNHASLMKFIELLQVDVPDHYLSLIKFTCYFSNHNNIIRTFPCFETYCYFGFVNGLAIVFNNNNGLVTVGNHRNQQLCEFGGRFSGKRTVQQGNFANQNETVQYKGQRPVNKIYQIYQRLHRKDANFINQSYESKIKIFNSIQSLIMNKFKKIVQDSKKDGYIDLNESLDYQQFNQQQNTRMEQIRDKMYSPPKKKIENISTTITPKRSELKNQSSTSSLLRNNSSKVFGKLESNSSKPNLKIFQESQIKSRQLMKGKITRPSPFPKQFTDQDRFDEQLKQRSNEVYLRRPQRSRSPITIKEKTTYKEAPSFQQMDGYFQDNQQQKHLFENYADDKLCSESNLLQETCSFKKLVVNEESKKNSVRQNRQLQYQNEEDSRQIRIQTESIKLQPIRTQQQPKKRQKSIQQFARPTYEDIQERRRRIMKDFQLLNKQSNKSTSIIEKPKPNDSPIKQSLISLDRQDQSSFGYIPLSISNKINKKKQLSTQKRQMQKNNLQQSKELSIKSKQNASRRKLSYSYANFDTKDLDSIQRKQASNIKQIPQQLPQQKRTYQYMYT